MDFPTIVNETIKDNLAIYNYTVNHIALLLAFVMIYSFSLCHITICYGKSSRNMMKLRRKTGMLRSI